MDLGISGKKALVCAASKGLGKGIAKALAEEGVELFLCARTPETLRQVVEELQPFSSKPIHAKACDLADPASRDALIQTVQKTFSTVDILIHNVGGPPASSVQETSITQWEQGVQQLFLSVVALNQAFLPGMKAQAWGRIIGVTSMAVLEPVANLAVSNGMRSAVTAMAKTLSDEVAGEGITVNCVAPGLIATDRIEALVAAESQRTGQSREACRAKSLASIPMQRMGKAEEFGAVVAFLCSQQAAYITGSTISVDGGRRRSTY